MKNRIKKFLCIFLACMSVFSLSACQLPFLSTDSVNDSEEEMEEKYDEMYLDYTLNDKGNGYIVEARGLCTESLITIPDTYKGLPVTTIGRSAFMNDNEITELVVGKNVTLIDAHAFYGCMNLQKVTLGRSVKKIEGYAFDSCSSLEYVAFNENLTNLSWHVFNACLSLTSIVVGTKIQEIYGNTFNYCVNIDTIYFLGTANDLQNETKVKEYIEQYLSGVTVCYFSETRPINGGDYWYWKDGYATKWT